MRIRRYSISIEAAKFSEILGSWPRKGQPRSAGRPGHLVTTTDTPSDTGRKPSASMAETSTFCMSRCIFFLLQLCFENRSGRIPSFFQLTFLKNHKSTPAILAYYPPLSSMDLFRGDLPKDKDFILYHSKVVFGIYSSSSLL